jgi:uncharacterized Zn finger protein
MARWRDEFDRWDRFPPSQPIAAKGGIRAQSFGTNWWARRWTEVLNGFGISSRLQRGRRYARQGQVLSIDIGDREIHAQVQGSRPTPYEVAIRVKPIPKPAWERVAKAVAAQAAFASKLLAGEMPPEMEEIFRKAGVSLFPERYRDLTTDCSCPDSSNPCKHIAAVYYLLGEAFDRDPFMIFRMRGISRDEFVGGATAAAPEQAPPEPLPTAPAEFWRCDTPVPPLEPVDPVTEAALPRRLGPFPFWRGREPFLKFLDAVYTRASIAASERLDREASAQISSD